MSSTQKSYTTYICDRCHESFDCYETNQRKDWISIHVQDHFANPILRDYKNRIPSYKWDACPKCHEELVNWWNIPYEKSRSISSDEEGNP